MEFEKSDAFYANALGVGLVVLTGTIIIFMPSLQTWVKKLMYGGAFILFIASEPLWMFGKKLFLRDK